MENNALTGIAPGAFASLLDLEVLDLSSNTELVRITNAMFGGPLEAGTLREINFRHNPSRCERSY